jgi:protein-tyrosine phosphatase
VVRWPEIVGGEAVTEPGAVIPIPGVPNLRDLGGWATRDGGRVRCGLVYRAAEPFTLDDEGRAEFAALGVRTVYDLRSAAECERRPDTVPDGARRVLVDVMADSTHGAPVHVAQLLDDPTNADEMLASGKSVFLFERGYRELVDLPSAHANYRTFFEGLADDANRPALFHCTTGKDRTGWAAATLLMLLGVADDDVMRDYLLTNEELMPVMQNVLDQFAAAGGDPELLLPVVGVEEDYLDAALDEMRTKYGTIEEYFATALGIDAPVQDALRDAFVEH